MAVVQKGSRWFVVLPYRDREGKRKQKWLSGFATEAEAREAEPALRAQRSARTVSGYLLAWADRRLASSRIREGTHDTYRRWTLSLVAPHLGAMPLEELRPSDVEDLYDALRGRDLSPETVRHVHAMLRVALRDAFRKKVLPEDLMADVDPPGNGHTERQTWSPEEVRRFLAFARFRDPGNYALWATLALTGMRRGEVLGLQWADVNLEEGTARVSRTVGTVGPRTVVGPPKTPAAERTVYLHPQVLSALQEQRDRTAVLDSPWVFPEKDGSVPNPNAVRKRLARVVVASGLPRLSVHGLRHSFATNAAEAGVPTHVLQRMLGHSNVRTTLAFYTHARDEARRDGFLQAAGAVFGNE